MIDYFLFMTSSLVIAFAFVRFSSQFGFEPLNLRHIILITIGDKEDSKQSQQMQAGLLTENFNL